LATDFRKMLKYQMLRKSVQLEPSFFHAGVQTDKANSRFFAILRTPLKMYRS